jgi:hypothetical protein
VAMITNEALAVLVPALGTCGYKDSSIHKLAMLLSTATEGRLEDIVGDSLNAMEAMTLEKLDAESVSGLITPEAVFSRYALPNHTRDMDMAAKPDIPSTSFEIPEEIRAVAHTALWLRDGIYDNGKVSFPVKGTIPLGKQDGNLFVHLAGCIASGCTTEFLEGVTRKQSENELFMRQARIIASMGGLDYENAPVLRRNTLQAKKELGL